jgi:hypothetical protein
MGMVLCPQRLPERTPNLLSLVTHIAWLDRPWGMLKFLAGIELDTL